MVPKIAVGAVEQDAGLEQSDVEYLRQEILSALNAQAAGRYETYLATFFPGPCDTSCQSAAVQQSGGSYYVTGEVRRFAGSYIVSLWLLRPVGGPAAPRVESEPLQSAAELLSGTRALVDELLAGSPFRSAAVVSQPAAATVQPAPALAPQPAAWGDQPTGDQWIAPELPLTAEQRSLRKMRITAWVLFGTGVLLMDIAGALWIKGLTSSMSDGAFGAAIAFTIAGPLITAASAIVGGTYRKRKEVDHKPVGLTALVAPDFAGLGLYRSF